MPVNIRRLLVEALKPRETSILELSEALCSVEGVEEVDAVVTDVDVKTETMKLTIKGPNISYSDLMKVMEDHSIAIKGVDEVSIVKVKPPPKLPSKEASG